MDTDGPRIQVQHEEPDEQSSGKPLIPWYKGYLAPMVRRTLIAVVLVVAALYAYYHWGHIFTPRLSSSSNTQIVPSDGPSPSSGDDNNKVLMDRSEVERLRARSTANTVAGEQTQRQSSMAEPGTEATAQPSQDSQSPLAPDGQPFTGSGRFQFYRQGNITWRLDTETGHACVIFATDEEWRKPKVYRRACGSGK